jgi:ribosomal protein S18 acetylase RimI-like enzyme
MMATDGVAAGASARRVEEVGLNAMQTQRQLFYDGWLLRVSPGKAKRARCVNAFFGSTLPLATKIAYCVATYDRLGLPPLFRMTPFDHPASLDAALADRGFVAFGETLVQVAAMERPPEVLGATDEVTVASPDAQAFVAAVGELRGSPAAQREAHRERLANAPQPRRHVVVYVGARPVCTATTALEDGYAGLFDVVTAPDVRGRGYATFACATLLNWAWGRGAARAYLQVEADNAAALSIYRRLGFATAYAYRYRGRPGELG